MSIEVQKRSYGVLIKDTVLLEAVAVEQKDIKQLIQDLQAQLPWELNEYALGRQPETVCVLRYNNRIEPTTLTTEEAASILTNNPFMHLFVMYR